MNAMLAVLGLASAAYGAAMALLYPAGWFWLVWVVFAAALLALAWARRSGAWARLGAGVRRAVCAVCAAAAMYVVVACGLIVSAATCAPPEGLDCLIVLGAGLNADGSPRAALRYRLDAALDYLDENPDTLCIVTGGQGSDEPCTEASAMRDYLVAHGLNADRILMEDQSLDTSQNFAYAAELLGGLDDAVGVVTNNFHLFRALALARGQGLADVYGIAAYLDPVYLPQATLRECLALAKDALAGNLA